MEKKSKIAVIGAGNGGHAYAGYLSNLGHTVSLYDRESEKIAQLKRLGKIKLVGQIDSEININLITDNLEEAMKDAERIYIVTLANAHSELAKKMQPYLKNDQIVILSPGRTNGALEFNKILRNNNFNKKIYIAESQSLVFACRTINIGTVKIIGIKENVLLGSIPKEDVDIILKSTKNDFSCFLPAKNVLQTSLENVGAILHPVIALMNAAIIERGNPFYFYEDLTPSVTNLIEKMDCERIEIGKALGLELHSVLDWVSFAYKEIKGNTLTERIKNNPAYSQIYGPQTLNCRMFTEDIPTGLVPMIELAKMKGIKTPIMEAIVNISNILMNTDFYKSGRTLNKLGIYNAEELTNEL